MSDFVFPTNTDRSILIGRTGSGKTQAGAWLLSHANFDEQPWIIVDYKYDSLLNEIEGVEHINFKKLPKESGLYIIHPHPHDEYLVDNMFFNIWAQEHTGVFIDEAYMTPNFRRYRGYDAMLTQGRSKHIPIISLTQRPCRVTPFAFSESDYFSVFHLNTRRDQLTVEDYAPISMKKKLPAYHSHWYDVKRDKKYLMQPVENRGTILARFNERLAMIKSGQRKKWSFFK